MLLRILFAPESLFNMTELIILILLRTQTEENPPT
jgi:hypothetical protein